MSTENELPVVIEENTLDDRTRDSFPKSGKLFSTIVGYSDVKKIFGLSINSQKPVHILLVGPPASAKTLFMLECMKLERSYFTIGSHSTRSGMLDYLFESRPRYLIVDEIEHMGIKDQTALLSLMETGILSETKFQKTRNTQLKTWVFATSNGTERMLTPLLSRFVTLHFKRYKYENFHEVASHILVQEGVGTQLASKIADAVWSKMKSKDIRDCMKIGRLAKSEQDVDWIVDTFKNYR
jgi:Holliday junction DNA helicase RuvB